MNLKATNNTETNKYVLEVEIPADEFNKAVDEAIKTESKKITIQGFRKGKAPASLIQKMYGRESFYEPAMDKLFQPAVTDAIAASGLEVIAVTNNEVTAIGAEGVTMNVTVVVKPEVSIEGYKGIEVVKAPAEVTDADVEAELARVQERNSRMVTVEDDRAALTGDTANIDFEGFCDGVAFDGGKGEGFDLGLGSGQFIPGFEDQIVGHKAGEEFDVVVKFPEDYQAEELKGKDATFKVKVNELKRKEVPVLDDEFAKDVSEFDTLEEYKESLRKELAERREKAAESAAEAKMYDALVEKVEGEIPAEMIDNEVDQIINDFAYQLQAQGLKLETYLQYTGMDTNALREQYKDRAGKQVKLRLALEKIAALEGIDPSEEDVNAEYETLSKTYEMEIDQIKMFVSEENIKGDLKSRKAFDLVKANAVFKTEE